MDFVNGGSNPKKLPGADERLRLGSALYGWSEGLLLALLIAIFLWRGFVPAWASLNTDFPNYYLTARLYRQGYPLERVYDWIWFQRQKDHAGIDQPLVGYIPLTLFSALPVLPLSTVPPLKAKHYWLVVNLVLLFLTGYVLNSMTMLGARRVAILTFLALVPLRSNFLYGQQHVLVLFFLTLAAWLYIKSRPVTSGMILAMAAGLKIYPALFLFYFARKKEWRAATGLLLGCLGIGSLCVCLFGFEPVRAYLAQVLPRALRGEDIDPYNVNWNSFTALLRRLFTAEPELNPHPLVHLPTAYTVLQPMCQALLFVPYLWLMSPSRAEAGREKPEWAGYAALLLILSSHPASYHYCVLILTGVLAVDYLLKAGERPKAAALVVLYALVCLPLYRLAPVNPSGWRIFLAFPRLYAMTALWIVLLWSLGGAGSRPLASRLNSREAAVFALLFLLLVAAGIGSNLRHFKGQFANYSSRLTSMPESLMATEPALADNRMAFTIMAPEQNSYVTANKTEDAVSLVFLGTDTFHPALARRPGEEWVELASTHSGIVRVPRDGSTPWPEPLRLEAEDAEQPIVSPDGKWLAFIRETRGRGGLWVKDLGVARGEAQPGGNERQVVDPTYDVRDAAFFPDGRIVLAAEPQGFPELFIADAISPAISRLWTRHQRTRFPAVSSDGQWLAYSRMERGAWQLWVMRFSTFEEHRLTSADCNAVTPAWSPDSKTLVYATDCGRGLGLTALCRIKVVP